MQTWADPMPTCLPRCREPCFHRPSLLVTLEGHFNDGDSPDSSPSGTGFGAGPCWAPRLDRDRQSERVSRPPTVQRWSHSSPRPTRLRQCSSFLSSHCSHPRSPRKGASSHCTNWCVSGPHQTSTDLALSWYPWQGRAELEVLLLQCPRLLPPCHCLMRELVQEIASMGPRA